MEGDDHGEAYTAIEQGELLSPEMRKLAEAETFGTVEGHACGAVMQGAVVLPGSKTSSRSKGSCRNLGDLTADRRPRGVGPHREGAEPKPMMHGREKSDPAIVAGKPVNEAEEAASELVEPRAGTKGNAVQPDTPRAQERTGVLQGLDRIRQAAKRKGARFTSLLHHVSVAALREAFHALKREAAPGVDGLTWSRYAADLARRLADLHERVHKGGPYRPQPARRVYIAKPDGQQRPLAVAALEDKIVQRAVQEVLNAIYEEEFLGLSYGFRPRRGPHDALDALCVGI